MDNLHLEIPIGRRTRLYRLFEMLPAILSYGLISMLFVLSLVSPLLASIYLLLIIITTFMKAIGIAIHSIIGSRNLDRAQKVSWSNRLAQLEDPSASLNELENTTSTEFGFSEHKHNLELIAASPTAYPRPSQLYHLIIMPAYNEPYGVIEPACAALARTDYDAKRLIVAFGYEERGGPDIAKTARRLKSKYEHVFKDFIIIKHPDGLADEIKGKGANITYVGMHMKQWCDDRGIAYSDVIITSQDCDNRPHKSYFDYVAYEYIVRPNRKRLSYLPIALFMNNIWDAPAPMRVIATGNSFWNVLSSMRPHLLRNFASHSQPMDALVEMGFWSKRTVVEDGHQYWRSFFHFKGDYGVVPIFVPYYQDAVVLPSFRRTLVAQFVQLRRWAYGASDIPYVATRLFCRLPPAPRGETFVRFVRLVDNHVTQAAIPLLITFGGWVPLLVNSQAARDIAAHQLPEVVSGIQRFAMIGLLITVYLGFRMLPPRPERYKRRRSLWMILQWGLMPITAIVYTSLSAFNAQTRLLIGRYLDRFDVTEKTAVPASTTVDMK